MNTLTQITQAELTKQEKLLIWMRRAGKNNANLAKFAKVAPITAGRWLRAESLPWYRVQILHDFGIPEELLPSSIKTHG